MGESSGKNLRPLCEIAAVLVTGAAFLLFKALAEGTLLFAVPCALLWGGYVIRRLRRRPSSRREWGVRLDNLRPASARCLPFLAVGALGILAYRLAAGWTALPASAVIVFVLYPAWALVQQFFVQGLVAGNLRRLGASPAVIVPIAAVLFGLVHVPEWPLVILCTAAGAVWTGLYLWTPNLIPLAVSHGWLGALAYYWLLGLDPWADVALGRL